MSAALPHLFEMPLAGTGQVYPCSLGDLEVELLRLATDDLQGLLSVGLVPGTAKDSKANARYFYSPRPKIELYSFPAPLSIRLQRHLNPGQVSELYRLEREFGMETLQQGSRWVGRWQAADLRRFILEHVLLHEIGHHVYHMGRRRSGLVHRPFTRESEQFAEAFALRLRRVRAATGEHRN